MKSNGVWNALSRRIGIFEDGGVISCTFGDAVPSSNSCSVFLVPAKQLLLAVVGVETIPLGFELVDMFFVFLVAKMKDLLP